MGRNALREVLRCDPKRIKRVFLAERAREQGKDLEDILDLLSQHDLPVEEVEREALSEMVSSDSHQSFVAEMTPRESIVLRDFLKLPEQTPQLLLYLDGVTDPQNFGAILRSAECFGVDLVLWSKNRGASLTPVASKASAGASELVPYCVVANGAQALSKLKQAGYWIVVSALSEAAESLSEVSLPERLVLVVGSEGKGVQQLIQQQADYVVSIPLTGRVQSLNVSGATAIMLYELQRKLGRG